METLFELPFNQFLLYAQIVDVVKARQRGTEQGRGVLPRTVQCFLDDYRAQQTLRRDMAQLAEMGVLVRVGERRGYRYLQ